MLEGTDLMSAYAQVDQNAYNAANTFDQYYGPFNGGYDEPKQQAPQQKSPAVKQPQNERVVAVPKKEMTPMQQPPAQPIPQNSGMMYDAQVFNKQYEQEQRILHAISELKRQKEEMVAQQQSAGQTSGSSSNQSYFDKLMARKKDMGRLFQFALIIVLGLSIHMVVKHYLDEYISNNDLSMERQVLLRLLYPVAIIFLLWNLKVFVK